jgi:MYXO-CTERM domain-containing protein
VRLEQGRRADAVKCGLVAGLSLVLMVGLVRADTVTINVTDRGWFQHTGRHTSSSQNTFTGRLSETYYRTFFMFSLAGLSETVTAAKLRLELENFYSPDSSETVEVRPFSGAVSGLTGSYQAGSTAGLAIYADLGTGAVLASKTVSSADIGTVLDFGLSSAGIADINSHAGSLYAVGLAVSSPGDHDPVGSEGPRFSVGSESRTHQLVLTTGTPIPLPPASWAGLAVLGGLALIRRHRRRKAA